MLKSGTLSGTAGPKGIAGGLEAIIFDFDGVIVDTEPLHCRAFQKVLAPYGMSFSWEEYLEAYVGLDDRGALRSAFKAARLPLDDALLAGLIARKAQAFQEEVAGGVAPYPGVVDLILESVRTRPTALCSGALRSDILPVLQQLGLTGLFPVMVSADEVRISKPDPESYLLAFRRLCEAFPGRIQNPQACLAIEDTPAGIASARGAGLTVLAVTNNFPPQRLRQAHHVVSTLEGMMLDGLGALIQPLPGAGALS